MFCVIKTMYDGLSCSFHDAGRQCTSCYCYQSGKDKPAYSVPAVRQHYEWGKNLVTGEIVILHCEQGVYDKLVWEYEVLKQLSEQLMAYIKETNGEDR